MRIHVIAAIFTIILASLLQIPLLHWLVLIVVIGGIFALEVINTAIERTVDFICEDFHPLAGLVKDIAAAAVLIFSITAFIIGILIFYPPIADILVGY